MSISKSYTSSFNKIQLEIDEYNSDITKRIKELDVSVKLNQISKKECMNEVKLIREDIKLSENLISNLEQILPYIESSLTEQSKNVIVSNKENCRQNKLKIKSYEMIVSSNAYINKYKEREENLKNPINFKSNRNIHKITVNKYEELEKNDLTENLIKKPLGEKINIEEDTFNKNIEEIKENMKQSKNEINNYNVTININFNNGKNKNENIVNSLNRLSNISIDKNKIPYQNKNKTFNKKEIYEQSGSEIYIQTNNFIKKTSDLFKARKILFSFSSNDKDTDAFNNKLNCYQNINSKNITNFNNKNNEKLQNEADNKSKFSVIKDNNIAISQDVKQVLNNNFDFLKVKNDLYYFCLKKPNLYYHLISYVIILIALIYVIFK